uniref:Uncharacterized protein n=1 Tax=Bionectria ochroleuca TaxID=29856 RepID=A0A8H7TS99_BIOOC
MKQEAEQMKGRTVNSHPLPLMLMAFPGATWIARNNVVFLVSLGPLPADPFTFTRTPTHDDDSDCWTVGVHQHADTSWVAFWSFPGEHALLFHGGAPCPWGPPLPFAVQVSQRDPSLL